MAGICPYPLAGILGGWAAFLHAHLMSWRGLRVDHHGGGRCLVLVLSDLCLAYLTCTNSDFFRSLRSIVTMFSCLVCSTNLEAVSLVISGIEEVSESLYLIISRPYQIVLRLLLGFY